MTQLAQIGPQSMKADFWHKRWKENQIGWHRQALNPMLEKWWKELGVTAAEPVLVPLAGKSLDLHWLQQQGHPVLGVELSEVAVKDFFAEAGLQAAQTQRQNFECFTYKTFQLWQGDVFDLTAESLDEAVAHSGRWAWYDRAALVALPPADRARYMKLMAELMPSGSSGLLLTFEYPQHETDGPPFSVEEEEVRDLCAGAFDCRLLEREMLLDPDHYPTAEELAQKPNRYVEKGLSRASEAVFQLRRL